MGTLNNVVERELEQWTVGCQVFNMSPSTLEKGYACCNKMQIMQLINKQAIIISALLFFFWISTILKTNANENAIIFKSFWAQQQLHLCSHII